LARKRSAAAASRLADRRKSIVAPVESTAQPRDSDSERRRRYVRYTPGMQVILTRDFLFGLFIAVVPALVPVVALQHLGLQARQLGLVFTSTGIGSLLGATLMLPYARAKASPNALTILAGVIQVAVLVLMAIVPNLWMFLPVTALAGISWTVSASELWIAGQRAMPDWARGRMNAVHMMASQGGVAVGGVCWGGQRRPQVLVERWWAAPCS
jgi:predicted MFS family arabinose efflux permease